MIIFTFGTAGCGTSKPGFSKAAAATDVSTTHAAYSTQQPPIDKSPGNMGLVSVNIALVGDIMVHQSQLDAAFDRKTGRYDFNGYFKEVTDFLGKPDLTIGNLETTLAGKDRRFSGYPVFNSPVEILDPIKTAGFDVLTNANNHSMDRGEFGVLETIRQLDGSGIKHTGTASSAQGRSQYLIVEIKGIKLGILAYTYGTNGIVIPKGKNYLVNSINLPQIEEDIKQIKAQGAEVVLVCPHFGVEYSRSPGAREKKLVEQLFAAGADIVAGSHPHVLQPMSGRDLPGQEGLFLAYSLGNFISAQRDNFKDSGVILNLTLQKDLATGEITLSEASYIPTWVQICYQQGKRSYRVVAVEKAIRDYRQGTDPTIRPQDYQRLLRVWDETTKLLSGPAAPDLNHI